MAAVAAWVTLIIVTISVTRLLIKDEFPPLLALRNAIIDHFAITDQSTGYLVKSRRWGRAGLAIAYLWTCWWCMSFWVAIGVVGIAWAAGLPVAFPFAFPFVARIAAGAWGLLEGKLGDERS